MRKPKAVRTLEARLTQAERERDEAKIAVAQFAAEADQAIEESAQRSKENSVLRSQLSAFRARADALAKALEPFSKIGAKIPPVRAFRAAKAALAEYRENVVATPTVKQGSPAKRKRR